MADRRRGVVGWVFICHDMMNYIHEVLRSETEGKGKPRTHSLRGRGTSLEY